MNPVAQEFVDTVFRPFPSPWKRNTSKEKNSPLVTKKEKKKFSWSHLKEYTDLKVLVRCTSGVELVTPL